jgi:GAF domain-containing protein
MTDSPPLDAPAGRPSGVDLALLDLLQRLDQAAEPEAMFEAVEQALLHLARPDRVAIGTLDPTTRRLRVVRLHGDSLGLPDHYETLPADEQSLIHIPLTQGIPVMHTLLPDRDVYRGDPMRRRHGMQQALIAPVVARGAVIGVLMLNSVAPDRFSVETATMVETIGRMLGLALVAHPDVTSPAPTSRVISDTLARIAMAETAANVRECLCHGVERATGASTLLFDRTDTGAYRFVGGHHAPDPAFERLDLDAVGADIAEAIASLIDASVGRDTVPQRVIVTGLPLGDDAPARIGSPDELPDLPGAGAVVIAPLHAVREVLGALVAILPETVPAELLPGHARAIFSLTDIAGPALHRQILVDRLEQRLAETETMRRLTDSIARTPRLQDALDIICRTSRLITGADFVAIAEVTPEHVIWDSASGAHGTAFLHQRLPGPAGVLGRLLAHQTAVLIEDARHHPEFSPEAMPVHTAEGLRSTAIIPVYVNARVRAAIVFAWRRPRPFGSDEVSTFHALAATTSTALASSDARMRSDDN